MNQRIAEKWREWRECGAIGAIGPMPIQPPENGEARRTWYEFIFSGNEKMCEKKMIRLCSARAADDPHVAGSWSEWPEFGRKDEPILKMACDWPACGLRGPMPIQRSKGGATRNLWYELSGHPMTRK